MRNSSKIVVRVLSAIMALALVFGLVAMAIQAMGAEDQAGLQQALENGETFYQLTADEDGVVIEKDMMLDLNGYNVTNATVAAGVTLQLIDSATDDYTGAYGSFAGSINGTVQQVVKQETKNYLVVEKDGVYSAHRFYAGIDRISLAPDQAALGYKAIFRGDAIVKENVTGYGYALWVNDYAQREYVKSGVFGDEALTLRIKNILKQGDDVINAVGAAAQIHANAIITFAGMAPIYGAQHTTTVREAMEAVNSALGADRSSYTQAQIDAVKEMFSKFETYMNGWQVDHILAVEKFTAIAVENKAYGNTVTLGELFAAVAGASIGNVEISVSGVAYEVIAADTWEQTAIVLKGVGEATITVTDNDHCVAASNTLTVVKADPEVEMLPSFTGTYGQTLAEFELPAGYAWVDPSQSVGNAGAMNEFAVIYTPADPNYNAVEIMVGIVVEKANPEFTVPENLTAVYGQRLEEIQLPAGFRWQNTMDEVGHAGENHHYVTYVPEDGNNYNEITNIEVYVTVSKADPQVPEIGELFAYYGDDISSIQLMDHQFTWESTGPVGDVGEHTYYVTYTPQDVSNYNIVEHIPVTVQVQPGIPQVPQLDTLQAYYGQTLADIDLPEGFTWTDPTMSVGDVATKAFDALYDSKNPNYMIVPVSVSVQVNPAEPTFEIPTGLTATYGQTLADVTLSGNWTWKDSGLSVGNVGTNSFTAVYTPDDTANYNTVEVTVSVAVAKANPTYTVPAGLTATEGVKLSTIELTDGFAWVNGDMTVAKGENTYAATFTPDDTANFNTVTVNITVTGEAQAIVDKFAQKMPAAAFTYRLGNGNTVALSSIFAAIEGVEIDSSKVSVTINALEGDMVSGTFTANTSDWTKGTLKFTGTGRVEIIIVETDGSNPYTLTFEIVNANNATGAASATGNNVVLLNNAGFSSLTVSNGYTLFGNGFTLTATSENYADSLGDCFVALDNGVLDNVRIVVPNFAYSFLYLSQAYNESPVQGPYDKTYYNIRSAVYMTGNSKVFNSYISGGRAAVRAVSGHPVLENTTIYGGAVANIDVGAVQSITLKDMTLIQMPIEGSVNGKNAKTVMGFSVLFEIGTEGTSPVLNLEGYLNQFAWVNEGYSSYMPTGASGIIDAVKEQGEFLHSIQVNGVSHEAWLNLGFAYWPMESGAKVLEPTINDNRTNQADAPYAKKSVTAAGTTAYVYSITNAKAHDVDTPDAPAIQNNAVTAPVVSFNDQGTGKTFTTKFDATNGWMSTLTVDLDTTGDYTFNFDNLVLSKYGKSLSYTVEGLSGKTVTLNESGVHTYKLIITDDVDCNGNAQYTYTFVLTATKTSIQPPVKVADPSGTALLVVKSKNSDWSCAVPALEGTQIKYYNKTSKTYETLSLASLTPSSTGKQNGTENFWKYSDPNGNFTLKVTSGYIHEGKQVYGMPVVVNNGGNKMYFTISSTTGYVSTSTGSRAVTLTYEFTDANGQTITFGKTWNFNYADYKSGTQYSYDEFVKGNLKEASSGGCVTPETLVTLADGTQKQIKDVTNSDLLMVWDFYKGEYAVVPAAIVFDHGYDNNTVIKLCFSDGTIVNVINLHQFMDATENKFVTIDAQTVAQYVGHQFAKQDGDSYKTVELVGYEISEQYIEAYGIISAVHYNILVNGMFSTDFMYADYDLFNYFAIGEDMKFDQAAMAEDIANYGLYTYADFAEVLTYEQFVAFNVQYFKIAVGKGVYTYEGILNLIATYLAK